MSAGRGSKDTHDSKIAKKSEEKATRASAIKQIWKQSELSQYFNGIKKAVEQQDISSFVSSLYNLGIYHCQKTKNYSSVFRREAGDDFLIFCDEFKGLSNSLPDKMHEFLQYALHVAQHYYRRVKIDNADFYDQLGYEMMSSGVMAYIDVLYPKGSNADKLFFEKAEAIKKDFNSRYKGPEKQRGMKDDEFRDELARPVISALDDMIQQKRIQGYELLFRAALDAKTQAMPLVERLKGTALSDVKDFSEIKGQAPDLNANEQLERIKAELVEKDFKTVNQQIKELTSPISIENITKKSQKKEEKFAETGAVPLVQGSMLSSLLEYRAKNFEKGFVIPEDQFKQLVAIIVPVASIESGYRQSISTGFSRKSMSQEKESLFVELEREITKDLDIIPPKSLIEIYHHALYSLYSGRDHFVKKHGTGTLIHEIGKWLPNLDKALGAMPLSDMISKAFTNYFKQNSESITEANFIEVYRILSAVQPILQQGDPKKELEKIVLLFLNKKAEGKYAVDINLSTFKEQVRNKLRDWAMSESTNDDLRKVIIKATSQIASPVSSPRLPASPAAADGKAPAGQQFRFIGAAAAHPQPVSQGSGSPKDKPVSPRSGGGAGGGAKS